MQDLIEMKFWRMFAIVIYICIDFAILKIVKKSWKTWDKRSKKYDKLLKKLFMVLYNVGLIYTYNSFEIFRMIGVKESKEKVKSI